MTALEFKVMTVQKYLQSSAQITQSLDVEQSHQLDCSILQICHLSKDRVLSYILPHKCMELLQKATTRKEK